MKSKNGKVFGTTPKFTPEFYDCMTSSRLKRWASNNSAPQKNTGFSRDDYIKFTTFVKDKRRPLFRTKTGKMFLDDLLSKIEQNQRQGF